MANRVLALTEDGDVTWCVAPPELRGKGRCKHIAHQKEGQTPADFLEEIEDKIKVEEPQEIPNYIKIREELISTYGRTENPNWGDVIRSIPNPFVVGSEEDGTFEEAEMTDFNQELVEDSSGNFFKLKATYVFRGVEFECDFGEVPAVNPDGTITIDGVQRRVLPVLDQNKAGVISYFNNIVVRQEDGRNIAFMMSKNPDEDTVKIYGKDVPIDCVQNYLQNGDITGLNSGQIWALKSIDPIAFERFPNLATDLRSLKELPPDEEGDLSYRRCIRYEDMAKEQMRLQMRRMGVTFRGNLNKRHNKVGLPEDPKEWSNLDPNELERLKKESLAEDFNEKYPLFYQVNLTENIKSDLIGRSNVQQADNLNPISALSQSQKISFTGPGGYNKDKVPYNVRMPHRSHQSVIDSMDVSSGKNVGLTATLSMGYIGEDRFIHKKEESDNVLSPSDFIPYKHHNDPNRAIMAVAHMKQACPILGGEDPEPLGDPVSDSAWSKIKGSKLGKTLRIAYVPDAGVFEDGVILAQSAADAMSTVQDHTYRCKQPIKDLEIGQRVERKMEFGGEEIKTGGIVTNITSDGFTVETVYEMTPGDKLAGRHGNKSVVSKILPDSEMPKILNETTGKLEPAQVIMSPLSVAGRKNVGQIMETNKSNGYDSSMEKKQKVVLRDGHQIEATAGKQFIMRLNHIAEKKLSSHADELDAKKEAQGARLGEMESILLSTSEDRLKILDYLRHQEAYDSHKKLHSLLKAIGVEMSGVNWND